ncbi:MAG: 3,4-dihydroxy-2-butanone-4-phosphate synthase [Actinobacteria bacterium]|nr:3,4-dihydroxy-2-butanone-4-phosphate synthase [Actinomycetota bacterium]NCY10370.1 3,4-dihydroxy-2-butanone-4-phosphate synthase [Actinomycetota bacterium]NDC81413.1 3,4-dihydroxy-2-butanone-4-phosphate synthase [Actinomycetota bacterium]NDG68990.1 3,4-dihydroxy-2-butanone-4-phosphate synthase [Actinomycetota bacterium]
MSLSIDKALDVFREGGFVIVTDDVDRENEGDLFLLASAATTEKIGFMIHHTSGVLCVAMTEERSRQLHLPLMVKQNQDTKRTAFTVTVDAKQGITTGISAEERANTIRALADLASTAEDFIRPGHIFPLIAHEGGLAARRGHTEAIVEMCKLVGENQVGVISELVNEDGSMMRGENLIKFAREQNIPILSIAQLLKTLNVSNKVGSQKEISLNWAELPRSSSGHVEKWQIATFLGRGGVDHALLRFGSIESKQPLLLRIHSECLTGDVLGSLRCDCGSQLERAMNEIERAGSGLVIYLRDQEGRGIGLSEKIKAYQLQDQGLDTVEANLALGHNIDERDFGDAAEILHSLRIGSVILLSNNPEKLESLTSNGIEASLQILTGDTNVFNERYIATKRERLGHK